MLIQIRRDMFMLVVLGRFFVRFFQYVSKEKTGSTPKLMEKLFSEQV